MTHGAMPELLAPAGNMEKARIAVAYGADAIYLAGKQYGLRSGAGNFSPAEMEAVVKYAHEKQARVYAAVNIFPRNQDLKGLGDHMGLLQEVGVDALIVSDIGALAVAKRVAPRLPLHLSTQANTLNLEAAKMWHSLGFSRLVLGRELTLAEVREIRRCVQAELEVFVHGSMCVAYSGRCLLSNVLTKRDANQGACAQSCRWSYQLVEASRPQEGFGIEEDTSGTYIMNSKDLATLAYLPQLIDAGVDSFKIEGRMRSAYYVAVVVGAYRRALDQIAVQGSAWLAPETLLRELDTVSHRPYFPGFLFSQEPGVDLKKQGAGAEFTFAGVVQEYDQETGRAHVDVRNRLALGDRIEIIQPRGELVQMQVHSMLNKKTGCELDCAHANYHIELPSPPVEPLAMLRIAMD